MSHLLANMLFAYTVNLVALMSPGPDFFMTLRNALKYGPKAGILTALGIASALAIHMSYCVAGIGILIAHSPVLFNAIKWIGAAYLFYIGVHALRSKGTDIQSMELQAGMVDHASAVQRKIFLSGFMTDLFNPKATLFLLSLFSQVLDPHTPFPALVTLAISFLITSVIWFSIVSMVVTIPPLRRAYARASKTIDRVSGVFFMALGIKLAVARL